MQACGYLKDGVDGAEKFWLENTKDIEQFYYPVKVRTQAQYLKIDLKKVTAFTALQYSC